MRWTIIVALALATLSGASPATAERSGPPVRVFVEPSSEAPELIAALIEEFGPDAVTTSTGALCSARIERRGDELLVAVHSNPGRRLLLARTITVHQEAAARRIAVRLVVGAVRMPLVVSSTRQREREPPSTSDRLVISPQGFVAWWQQPATLPQIGLLVDLHYLDGDFGGGLVLAAAGGLCCSRSTADVEGRAFELHAVLEGRAPLLGAEDLQLGLHAGFGVSGYFVTARPVFAASASPGTSQDVTDLQVIVLAGLEGRWRLDPRWALVARLSLRASIVGRRVRRPAAFDTNEPLNPGGAAPWFSAGVAWDAF